jgi:FAD binding domain
VRSHIGPRCLHAARRLPMSSWRFELRGPTVWNSRCVRAVTTGPEGRFGMTALSLTCVRCDRSRSIPRRALRPFSGGATSGDLIAAAAAHGLVAVTGAVGAVGVAGLGLGGGYGPLIGRHGLALDNLLAAEVVLANGRKVSASATENEDLFWALRGGGGNFGVVTSMKIRLHALDKIVSGVVLYPRSEAETVLRRYAEFSRSTDDELSVISCIMPGPDGEPVLVRRSWARFSVSGIRSTRTSVR